MDSADDNAVSSEPEVRRTRSGRAVKAAPTPVAKQAQRKRKKMVLVEVEVSDEEEENSEQNVSTDVPADNASNDADGLVEKTENHDDSNSVQINESNNDSSVDQNDSTNCKEDSEQYSNQESLNAVENQDSLQTEDSNLKVQEEKTEDAEVNKNSIDETGDAKIENSVTEGSEEPKYDTDKIETEKTVEDAEKSTDIQESMDTEAIESDSDKDDTEKMEVDQSQEKKNVSEDVKSDNPAIDQDTENISEDELPTVQAAKVPETEEVSDEELPGPKLAELPADTEVVSEDELPTVKKEGTKRKLEENEYDPGSPTSETETAAKKPALENTTDIKKEEKKEKEKRKLPELDKYWKAVNDDPTDFTGWTYLLQYVDQENDMEAAREAYDAFLSHYPYCYGYWRKYADYEKRKGNKKKCEEVFERGLKAIPLSVDLWLHYLNYTRSTHGEDEDHIRAQYERALTACGLEFRSDRLWDGYIKWESEGKRLQNVTKIYDRLLATPTQGYTNHFDNFQEHVANNAPNKILEVDEFLALRKEVRHMLKHDASATDVSSDAPPGEEEKETVSTDEETTALKERIVSIRRKIHKNTVNAVTARWNFEEGIKRPYFHVKPLERCQLKNWKEYLDYEIEQGDQSRIVVLFERCLIACALYEEFWLRFVHYLENCNDQELKPKIKDVYERACTIHHLNKPTLHLQWAMFEECCENYSKAAEILVNLEKSVPNLLQVAYRRINLERRRNDLEKCSQLYEHYISNSKNKLISSNLAIKYARFCLKVCKDPEKSLEILKKAIEKDPINPRLYLQLIDLTLQKDNIVEKDVIEHIDLFLSKDSAEVEQKVLFAQRKLEFLEDFGSDIKSVQKAYEEYQKYCKLNKDKKKKEDSKSDKKSKEPQTAQSSYNNYGSYSSAQSAAPPTSYTQYSSAQPQGQYGGQYGQYSQNDQYQYQNWQYSQSGYGNYGNQWGGYGNYY